MAEKRPIIIRAVQSDPDYVGHDLAAEQGLRSMICVPLTIHDRAVGVMSCYTDHVRFFAADEIKALETLSKQVGFRIGPALHERVIYRELFPFGLTVADLAPGVRPLRISEPRDAVRKEVDAVLAALGLDRYAFDRPATEPQMTWGR